MTRYTRTAMAAQRERQLDVDAERLEHPTNRVHGSWNLEHNPPTMRHFVEDAIAVGRDINRTRVRLRLNPDVRRQ